MLASGPLRILIPALHYFGDRPSGADRLAFDHAHRLAELGHEVWILAQGISVDQPRCTADGNLRVLRYAPPRVHKMSPRRLWIHRRTAAQLLRRYVGEAVDVVHGHALLTYDAALWAYRGTARTCYSLHSPVRPEILANARGEPMQRRMLAHLAARVVHRVERKCINLSQELTAFSAYTKSLIGQLHGSRFARKIQVIPGWVDPERFTLAADRKEARIRLRWPAERKIFLTVRRLVPRMGIDRLLQAMGLIRSWGFSPLLVVGGTGPKLDPLRNIARDLGLAQDVLFAGSIPEDMLPLMYVASDAFVLPTAELECFGLIVIESLACGVPVLATPVGAIPEILRPIEPCWLSADEDPEALARLLAAFLAQKLPIHDAEYLRNIVLQKYSKPQALDELVAVTLGSSPADRSCNSRSPLSTRGEIHP